VIVIAYREELALREQYLHFAWISLKEIPDTSSLGPLVVKKLSEILCHR
jgi:hypothetical protein